MSSVRLCGGLLLGGFVTLANGVQTCPGEARFPPSHACDQPGKFKVCAQLLAYPGGSTLKPWGSKDYFTWMKQSDPSAAVGMMRGLQGDSACIGVEPFATVAQLVGCANVHINCEASDTSAMLRQYRAKGLDAAAACLTQTCPASVGLQPAVVTPYPTMAPAALQSLPTRPPLVTQAAAAAAATPYPTMAMSGATAGTAPVGLTAMKPIIDINLPSDSAAPGGSPAPSKTGDNQAPVPMAKMGSNPAPTPAWAKSASNPSPSPAGLPVVTAGNPVTQSPALSIPPATPATQPPALSKMVLPNGLSISGSAAAPPMQTLGQSAGSQNSGMAASSGQAAAEAGGLPPLAGGSIAAGGAPPTGIGGPIASGGAPPTANFKTAAAATPAPGSEEPASSSSSGTAILGGIGNIICLVLVCGVCALGAFLYLQKNPDMKHKLGGMHPIIKEHLDKLPSGRGGYGLENRMNQPGAYGGHGQDAYGGHQQGLYGDRQQDAYGGQGQDPYGGRQQGGSFAGQQQDRYAGQQPEGYPGHQYQEVDQRGAAGGGWGARSQQPGGSFHGAPGSFDGHGPPVGSALSGFGNAVANAVSGGGYGPPPPQDSWNHAAGNSPNRGGRNNSPGRDEQNAPFRHDAYRNPFGGGE